MNFVYGNVSEKRLYSLSSDQTASRKTANKGLENIFKWIDLILSLAQSLMHRRNFFKIIIIMLSLWALSSLVSFALETKRKVVERRAKQEPH